MAVAASEPVTIIKSIDPATAEALQSIKVFLVFDLLRGSVRMIHEAVNSLTPEAEVESWRAMASLLQVAEVTPQWAEALVRAEITTIEMLFRKSLDDIDAVMKAAKQQGIIPEVPTAVQISNMLEDAAVLRNTGSVTGALRNQAGEPISGASVRIGSIQQQSDERGRFRLLRLPLVAELSLYVSHPDYESRTIQPPPVVRNVEVIDGRIFLLHERNVPSASDASEATLSELDGDVLPGPVGQPLRSAALDSGNARPRDILKVYELYERSPDAGLVSYLKSYQAGEFIVHTIRVPLSDLTPNVQLGDQFLVADAGLTKISFGPGKLHRYKIRLRLRKKLAGRNVPADFDERDAFIQECNQFLRENGYFEVP